MLLRLSPQKVWLPLSSGSCVHPGSLPWSGRRFPKGPLLDPARSSRPLANRPRDEEVRPLLREAQVPVQTGGGGGLGGSTRREDVVDFGCRVKGHFWAASSFRAGRK